MLNQTRTLEIRNHYNYKEKTNKEEGRKEGRNGKKDGRNGREGGREGGRKERKI